MTATVTAMAGTFCYRQRPASARNGLYHRADLGYVRPEERRAGAVAMLSDCGSGLGSGQHPADAVRRGQTRSRGGLESLACGEIREQPARSAARLVRDEER